MEGERSMIPSLLAQSQGITPKAKPKARFTFTSPKTGKTYEWTKPNDPTEDDVKSLIAIENQLAGDLDFAKKVSGNVDAAKARTPKKPTPTGAEVFGRGLRGMAKDIEGALGPIQSTARDAVLLGPVPFIANALTGRKAPSIKDVLPKEAAPILDVLVPSSIVTDPIDVAGQFLVDPKQAAYDQFGKAFDPKAPTLDRILTGLNIAGLIPGAFGAVKGVQKVAKGISKGAKAVGVVDEAAEAAAKSLLRNPADLPVGDDLAATFRPKTVPDPVTPDPVVVAPKPTITPLTKGIKEPWQVSRDEYYKTAKVLYHGGPDIPENVLKRKSKGNSDMGALFFTDNKDYALQYAKPQLYEVDAAAVGKNIFDPRKPKHLAQLKKGYEKLVDEGEYESLADAMADFNRVSKLDLLDWATGSQYSDVIEAAGFKGAVLRERPGAIARNTDGSGFSVSGKPIYSVAYYGSDVPVSRGIHRDSVAKALESGKPVPPEVLADYPDLASRYKPSVTVDPLANLSPEELAAQKIVPTRGTPTTVADVEPPATNLNEIKTGFELTLKAPKGTFSYKVVGKAPRIKDGSKSWLTEVTGPQGTSRRYESETSLRAKQKTIEESVRVSDSFKWLNEAGDVAKTEKSTQSNSTYATVNTPSGKTVKVRSSDHLQPADDQALRSGLSKARVITLPKGTKVRVYEGGDGSLGLDFYNGVTDEGRMFAIGAARKFDESGLIDDVITIADNPTTPATVTVPEVPAVAPVSAPKPTPEAPTPAPSATPGRFAASNAASNDIRADLGIDKLPEPTRRTWDTVLEDAKKSYNADVIDARIADTKNPLNDTETAQAAMRSAELRNALRTATGDAYDGIEKKLIDHTIALREAGTEQGRALAARNMAILNDYSLDGMYRRFAGASKAKKADDIPKETRDEIKRLTDEREAVTVERDRLKAELDAKRAELATKAVSGEVSAVRSRRVKPGDVARKKELITKILDRQKEYVSSVPGQFLFDAAPEIKELARIKIAEGMDKLDDIRAAVLADLNGAGIDLDGSQFDAVMAGEFNSRLAKRELSAYQLAVKEAREARKASDAGRIAKAESRLKLLDERLQSRLDKALSKTKQGRDLLDAEKKVRVREIELDKIVNDARARREWDAMPKGFQALTSVMGLSRGLVLGADAGSILNQGAFALLTRPMSALKAARSGLGAIKSEKALIDVLGSVRANPNFDRAVTAGLDVKAALGNFENEFYNSDLLNKAPGYAQGSRFYDGQMTALRMNLFNSYVESLKRMKSGKYTGGKNAGTLTDEDYKLIAEMVNTTTGVGTGSIAQGLKAANKKINLLLAPGYRISRIKTAVGFPFFEAVKKGNYRVASIILGDYLRFFGGLGAAAAGLKAAGQDVELDPRSADFMKVRKGNTSISLGAGVEAPIKAIAQTFGGAIPSRAEGEKQGKANSGMARASTFNEWFVRSVSPFYSNAQILGSQVVRRANAEPGEELKFKNFGKNVDALTPEGQENLIKMQLPLWSQQAWDLVKDSDVSTEQKYWLMVGSIFGLPVNVKERKP